MRDPDNDVVTIWLPLLRRHQTMLSDIHREMHRRDTQTSGNVKQFAAMTFMAMLEQAHAKLFPKMIVEPGQVVLK